MKKELPLFMQAEPVLKIVTQSVPKNTKAYFIGGAIRNALIYHYFNEKLPPRDFDILLIGDSKEFISNLRAKGFTYDKIKRKNQVVLKIKKFSGAKKINDYVWLDIHLSKKGNILDNLRENANFTINSFALPLSSAISDNWIRKVVYLPGALGDLRSRKMRLNKVSHPADLYACIRFVSKGFEKPSKDEVNSLLEGLAKFHKAKFNRNVKKVFVYVGSEKKARRIARDLGIKEDIFSFKTIELLRVFANQTK